VLVEAAEVAQQRAALVAQVAAVRVLVARPPRGRLERLTQAAAAARDPVLPTTAATVAAVL